MVDTVDTVAQNRLRVMMIAEGTYPYHWGGVSTWCHLLLSDLPNVDFTLVSLVGDPAATPQFKLPASVVDFRPIPLWGVREILETAPALRLDALWSRKRRTDRRVVTAHFVPLLRVFLEELFADAGNPQQLALLVHAMHRFFLDHDFDKAMRTEAVWDCFVDVAKSGFPRAAVQHGYPGERFSLADLTTCFHWLYHWLFPLASPLPKVDVAHAAMAGACTLVAVAAKLEHGAAFMLTEHGIYLRERYLAEAATSYSLFRKLFSLRFARRMTELSYALADQIAPCCDFNQRWELRNGAQPAQVQTIYYGVDSVIFTPVAKPAGEPPVVVWVGRIDPLKDLFTLLRAAAVVHATQPDVQFRLYGSAPPGNEAYYEKCLELRAELGLEQTVIFGGFRASPASAFNEGDLVVLSSVSEAFPFVILEAMLCEKPVVATAVGGVPEQIEGCGIAVEPRNPVAMAEAMLKLLDDPDLRHALGEAARRKAIQEYGVRQSAQAHETAYRRLAQHKPGIVPVRVWSRRQARRGALPFLRSSEVPAFAFDLGSARQHSDRTTAAASVITASLAARLRTPVLPPVPPPQEMNSTASQLASRIAAAGDHDTTWRQHSANVIAALAIDIAQRNVQPIDALEVTALLEASGVTDDVAQQRYGAPDVFMLGEAVLAAIKARRLAVRPGEPAPPVRDSRREALIDYLKGPLGLMPPILLLLTIIALSGWANWSQM